jgi:hypothetical protein
VQFGVPYFSMFDPRLRDHPVDVSMRGTITFKITDYQNFVGMHALVDFDLDKFKAQIKDSIISFVQDAMMDIQDKLQTELIQINTKRREIRGILQDDLGTSLLNTYGVTMTELNIAAIEIDQECEGYKQLAKITRNAQSARAEKQIDLSLKGMDDSYELNKQNNAAMQGMTLDNMAATMAINREEGQHAWRQQTDQNAYAQKMQTDMGGFALHQLNQQEEIAKAQAAAMGTMGAGMGQALGQGGGMGGGGGGSGGGGFNPGAMMAGMAVGGAMGQGMAGMLGNAFNQMGQQQQASMTPPGMPGPPPGMPPQMPGAGAPPPMPGAGAPPPMPGAAPAYQFSVSVNGQTYGPYDMGALTQMAGAGQINAQSMVWRQGMAGWQEAGTVPELAQLFRSGAPPPPPPPVG